MSGYEDHGQFDLVYERGLETPPSENGEPGATAPGATRRRRSIMAATAVLGVGLVVSGFAYSGRGSSAAQTVETTGQNETPTLVATPATVTPESGFFAVDEQVALTPTVTPAPAPTPTATAEPDRRTDDVRLDSSEAISVQPSEVATAGSYPLDIAGTGFRPDADVLVVTCVLPGEPLLRGASDDVVADRLAQLDVLQHCAFDDGVEIVTDSQGAFTTQLIGAIQSNSMLLAADLEAELAAYVLVPIRG